jgi:PAS domain S-box-containing protein
MTAETLKRVFDPFFTTDLQHGMGLGMHIVYNLVTQRFGGEIACDSEPGAGAHFHIEVPLMTSLGYRNRLFLPVRARSRTLPDTAARSGSRLPPWKVLVVDDEPDIHAVLRLAMQDMVVEGHPLQLFDANSAEEAKAMLAAHADIALVLLDVVMETEQAGLELVRHVRQEMGNRMVRIVLVTGQPGYAPQREVVANYEIDGYRLKSELTADRIFVSVYAGLRAYRTLQDQALQRVQLDAAEEDLRQEQLLKVAIVESSDDAIIGVALDGIITSWNHAAEKILGYPTGEMVGKSIQVIIPGDRREEEDGLFGAIRSGVGTSRFETERLCKDGRVIPVSLTTSPICDRDGQIIGASTIIRDITERKKAKAELEQYRHHLEELVDRRTTELSIATPKPPTVAKSVPGQHEPRDPHADERHHRPDPPAAAPAATTPEQADRLDKIDSAAKHLLAIINDILDSPRSRPASCVLEQPTSRWARCSTRCAR